MLLDPSRPLRSGLRRYLGIEHIHEHLQRMENTMANWQNVLNGIVEQTTAASAAQATSFHNLQSAIDRQTGQLADLAQQLADAVANNGEVTPEMQAKVDQITQSLTDMKDAADAADNGFEPVEEPTEPTQPEGQPVEGDQNV